MIGISDIASYTSETAVFNLERTETAGNLSKIGDDVGLCLFHRGSRFFVENMSEKLGIPTGMTPFMAGEFGSTVSFKNSLMLEKCRVKYSFTGWEG